MEDTSTSTNLSDSLKYFWTGFRASSYRACRFFVEAESASSLIPPEDIDNWYVNITTTVHGCIIYELVCGWSKHKVIVFVNYHHIFMLHHSFTHSCLLYGWLFILVVILYIIYINMAIKGPTNYCNKLDLYSLS